MVTIIDGKALANQLKEELKEEVAKLPTKPVLAVIIVGENPASQVYVRHKHRMAEAIGITSIQKKFPESISEEDLLKEIAELNQNKEVNGILVQLPLPKHINTRKVLTAVDYEKDVDGFHPINMGSIAYGESDLIPCTPKGIMKLIESVPLDISGKDACVVGRSTIVGKPIAMLLTNKSATVTVTHSRTKNLSHYTKHADILVVAVGKAKFITKDMVKEDAVIIDVGINRIDGKLFGDVDFENVKDHCHAITPVPGGVGPMTVAMLMENTVIAYKKQNG